MPSKVPKQLRSWNAVVSKVRREHPEYTFKQVLVAAKSVYRRGK
jgi:hypothetical protein